MDLRIIKLSTVVVILASLVYLSECKPVYPNPRWFDYDYFPVAKPIQDSGTGQVVGTVNPLRPYEPWVLDCFLLYHEKVEPGKRHEKCKEVDEENEKEYGKFLSQVTLWEEAYPERAARWNERFPDAKENEKKKYEQLKLYASLHKKNVETSSETPSPFRTTSSQSTEKPDNDAKKEDNVEDVDVQGGGGDSEEEQVQRRESGGETTYDDGMP